MKVLFGRLWGREMGNQGLRERRDKKVKILKCFIIRERVTLST